MISFFRTDDEKIFLLDAIEPGCWVHVVNPTQEELNQLLEATHVDRDFLVAALDEEERSRVETENGQTLIVVDTPTIELSEKEGVINSTFPLGIILTEDNIFTVCLKDSSVLQDFTNNRVKSFSTKKKSRFILQILYRNAAKFLVYLRQIDKKSTEIEGELHKSMKNKELIAMLNLEKSLVYFSTSLKSNEAVLERLMRMEFIRRYPDDTDLLEDVIIENKQAIEMCTIYRDILSGTMDAFASVISNNLNIVMKLLTSITIILTIPTLFASLWGMNVPVPFQNAPWGFAVVCGLSALTSIITAIVMFRKKLF
ncbi:MAG: magnesium transporter CorA family protein [Acutalibacteraceae bacterium]|jgi:magnesium transporter